MTTSSSSEISEVLKSIDDQKGDSPDDQVYVIEIMSIRFERFDQQIKDSLERFTSLQMLTINDCLLKDLSNFPHLPSLIRLDLVFNKIPGTHLKFLRGSRHLQSLMIGANVIENIIDLQGLGQMRELIQLDLLNNPVVLLDNYRTQVFQIFPSLVILDTLDRKGIDQEKAALDVSAARIPSNLFEVSKPQKVQAIKNIAPKAVVQPQIKQVIAPVAPQPKARQAPKQAPKQNNSSLKVALQPVVRKARASNPLKNFKSNTKQSRTGLVFPCGRIRRYLKQTCREYRISSGSNIFLAGVLEYLAAEILETAGNYAKQDKKSRITPVQIRDVFRRDAELNDFVKGAIISEGGSTSTNTYLNIQQKQSQQV